MTVVIKWYTKFASTKSKGGYEHNHTPTTSAFASTTSTSTSNPVPPAFKPSSIPNFLNLSSASLNTPSFLQNATLTKPSAPPLFTTSSEKNGVAGIHKTPTSFVNHSHIAQSRRATPPGDATLGTLTSSDGRCFRNAGPIRAKMKKPPPAVTL